MKPLPLPPLATEATPPAAVAARRPHFGPRASRISLAIWRPLFLLALIAVGAAFFGTDTGTRLP